MTQANSSSGLTEELNTRREILTYGNSATYTNHRERYNCYHEMNLYRDHV